MNNLKIEAETLAKLTAYIAERQQEQAREAANALASIEKHGLQWDNGEKLTKAQSARDFWGDALYYCELKADTDTVDELAETLLTMLANRYEGVKQASRAGNSTSAMHNAIASAQIDQMRDSIRKLAAAVAFALEATIDEVEMMIVKKVRTYGSII